MSDLILPSSFDLKESQSYKKVYTEGIYNRINFNKSHVAVDVGANMGILSNFLKDKVGKLIGIEPCQDNIPFLKANCPTIVLHPYGAWDQEDEVEFYSYFAPGLSGVGHFAGWDAVFPAEPTVSKLKVLPLDIILKDEPMIDFINMDIEGSELKALVGAKKIILKYKPLLAISTYHRYDDKFRIPEYIFSLVPEYKMINVGSHEVATSLFFCKGG